MKEDKLSRSQNLYTNIINRILLIQYFIIIWCINFLMVNIYDLYITPLIISRAPHSSLSYYNKIILFDALAHFLSHESRLIFTSLVCIKSMGAHNFSWANTCTHFILYAITTMMNDEFIIIIFFIWKKRAVYLYVYLLRMNWKYNI